MPSLIQRRTSARRIREEAAEAQFLEPSPVHVDNGDEGRYPNRIGNFTKGLMHDPQTGEVVPSAYDAFLTALRDPFPGAFDELVKGNHLGCSEKAKRRRFVNPQAAFAFDLEGIDSHQLTMRAAPAFASAEEAGEMVELYWMSLLRDVTFAQYATNATAINAAADLSQLSDFRGPKVGGQVTPQTLFRDPYPGCTMGPYVSQFLLQPVDFGAQSIDTRILTNAPGSDFAKTFPEWLKLINGCQPGAEASIGAGPPVFCYNGRALAQYVHKDFLYQAYFVACVNLLTNGYPADAGNPYGRVIDPGAGLPLPVGSTGPLAEVGFGTFGGPFMATLVTEPATRALKHQWYQKWQVHRRVRPEEFGGRVEAQRLNKATYPFHPDLLASTVLKAVQGSFHSHLLAQAFPEGSPMHTAYGSGHATVAGACVSMLKWFFDESTPVKSPVVPDPAHPGKLIPYVAPAGEPPLTVGGELNKLASNISQGRNIAGVHWRTDASEANRLGEELAISMLKELGGLFNESVGGNSLTRFDGTTITI
ncbi:MAG: hypothetical protein QOD01_1473 [Actinomycetota bacterium]|jgi:hypothetical protein|nr:hypothetical protein [Actinomycetota bacterium]